MDRDGKGAAAMIVPEALIVRKAPSLGISAAAVSFARALEELRVQGGFAPTLTAAVGRIASAALLLARTSGERTSVTVSGRGPVRNIGALASPESLLGIEVENPQADVPVSETGALDVPALVGDLGLLRVERAGKEEAVPFVRGGIGEEIAHYLWEVEEKRSLVVLSEVLTRSGVEGAGGLIVVLEEEVDEAAVSRLERNLDAFGLLSDRLKRQEPPEIWLGVILAGL